MNKFTSLFALATVVCMMVVIPARNASAQTEPNTVTRGQWDSQTQELAQAALCIRGNNEACNYSRNGRPIYSTDSTPVATQTAYNAREEQVLDILACAGTPERRFTQPCRDMASNMPALLTTPFPTPATRPAPLAVQPAQRPAPTPVAAPAAVVTPAVTAPAPTPAPAAAPTLLATVQQQAPMGMGMPMAAGGNGLNWCGNDRVLFTGPVTPRHGFLDTPPPFDQNSSGGRMIVFEINTQTWNGTAPFSFAISVVNPTLPITGSPIHLGMFDGYTGVSATPATIVRYAVSGHQCMMPLIPNDGRVHRVYLMIPPHAVDVEVQAFSSPLGGISTNVCNRVVHLRPFTNSALRGDVIVIRPDSYTPDRCRRAL